MKTMAVLMGSILLLGLLPGCQQPIQKGPPEPDLPKYFEDIVWVTLSIERPFLDDDQDRVPDGALIRVMLNRPEDKAFVAGKGSMIIHLVKRDRNEKGTYTDREMYTWTITQEDFQRALVRQRYGIICHQIAIYWHGLSPQGPGWYLKADFVRTDQKRVGSRLISLIIPEDKPKSPRR